MYLSQHLFDLFVETRSYSFSTHGMFSFGIAFLVLALGILSVIRSRFNYNSLTLALLNGIIGLWLICDGFAYMANTKHSTLHWFDLSYLFIPLISPAAYIFACSFITMERKHYYRITLFIILGLFFSVSQFSSHLIYSELYEYQWGVFTKYHTWFGALFLVSFFTPMLYSFYEIVTAYNVTTNKDTVYARRLKLLGLSYLVGYIGSINFFPAYGFNVYPLGFIYIVLYLIIIFYAIEKYYLLDINMFVANKIIDAMSDALMVCDSDGMIKIINPSTMEMGAYRKSELINSPVGDLIHVYDDNGSKVEFVEFLKKSQLPLLKEAEIKCKDGMSLPVSLSCSSIYEKHSSKKGWIIIMHDLSEFKKNVKKLVYLSSHDPLTDIYNRLHFEELLDFQIKYAKRHGNRGMLLKLDIDHFKEINDTFGHQVGDQFLIDFSSFLKKKLREIDILGRIGGDEFGVIITNIQFDDVDVIANKFVNLINQKQFKTLNHKFYVSASIGVTLIPEHGEDTSSLIKNADFALQKCKLKNRNAFEIYSPNGGLKETFKSKLKIANLVKSSIDNDELTLYAQPIWDLKKNKVTHYELLLRIKHREKVIGPDEFLSVAEEYGLMNKINFFVLNSAIKFIERYEGVYFSLNMSANVLSDNRILEELELSLNKKLFDPQRMIIEITENVVATHMETALGFIHRCKKFGIKFALDDFGVGLSSFSQLKGLPVDYLKIDGSFIQHICHSDIDKQFVKSMVNIARCLNIMTVAEYVEDKQTEAILAELGVSYTQGFYYGKPDEVSKVIEGGKNML